MIRKDGERGKTIDKIRNIYYNKAITKLKRRL